MRLIWILIEVFYALVFLAFLGLLGYVIANRIKQKKNENFTHRRH